MDEQILSLLYVPCRDVTEGRSLATELLKENLIVCANIISSMLSLYRWEGGVQAHSEALMIIKTLPNCTKQVSMRIKQLHSYDCPLILQFPAFAMDEAIYKWAKEEIALH